MRAALLIVLMVGCAGTEERGRDKPVAPVEVSAVVSQVGGGVWEVLVEGVGDGEVSVGLVLPAGVELVSGERAAVGMGRQTIVARVWAPAGARVAAGARVGAGARVTSVVLGGEPRLRRAGRVVATPFGPVAESSE